MAKKSKSKTTLRQWETNTSKAKTKTTTKSTSKSQDTYKSNKNYYKAMQSAEKNAPKFRNNYAGLKASALNELNNKFSADLGHNDVYTDFADDYRLLGTIAAEQSADMTDSLSGGYGTTYGDIVARQQLDSYLGSERDILPQILQQEKQNYQQDIANTTNLVNLYNQAEAQDFAEFQSELNKWNQNRDYYYNKWLNDYMAHQTHKENEGSKETSVTTESGTQKVKSITPVEVVTTRGRSGGGGGRRGSGRRSGYTRRTTTPKITKSAYKDYDGAIAWLSNNGYDVDGLLTKREFEQKMNSMVRGGTTGYANDRGALNSDYRDYILDYLQEAMGEGDGKSYFTTRREEINKSMKDYYKKKKGTTTSSGGLVNKVGNILKKYS